MGKEKKLAKEIRLLGLTRHDVAGMLNITEATLSNWVTGKHPIPPIGVRKLQDIGVSLAAVKDPSKEV